MSAETPQQRYAKAVRAALAAGKRGDQAEWHRLAAIAKAIKEGRA
jgi:hypothetical protein